MSLTAADVVEIMQLIEGSSFDELSLELNGMKLNLRRGSVPADGSSSQHSGAVATPAAAPTPAAISPQVAATNGTKASPGVDPSLHEVTAPLLGTFYLAPKPGAPPFVEPGSLVEPDTVIGIIEVMKLMNSVRAGVRGKVAEIVAGDGTLVEFGETLMRVTKSG